MFSIFQRNVLAKRTSNLRSIKHTKVKSHDRDLTFVHFYVSLLGQCLCGNGRCHGVGSGPSGLEVEATRNTIDVEHFASEVKPRIVLAFEGVAVDTRKGNATTGDEFIFECRTPHDGVVVIHNGVDKSV